jgi:hypothetical protein
MFCRTAAALLLTTALVSPAALAAQAKYPATVDVFGGVDGDGPGGGLELMAPFAEGEGSLFFGLARGTMWDETGAGGMGLGYRTQALPGFILGGYGMVDYHHGASNEGYFQGVLGLEALTESFDFRINGYLPEDDETTLADVTGAATPPIGVVGDIVIVDHEIGIVTGSTAGTGDVFRAFEQPLPGVDAEIGYRLPVPGHDFRIFLGAFHFEGGNDYENVTGPKARAEWRIHDLDLFGNNSRLTLEAGIRDDDVRGTDASAGVRIRIPFGGVPSNQRGHELAGLDQRMLDPIRREDHIVMGDREETVAGTPGAATVEAVRSVETGNEITSIWFADGAGGGDGTEGNETDLGTAVTGAGMGGLIVALGSNGDLTGNVTLAADQILLGGDSPLEIENLSGGVTATYNPGDTRPLIVDGSAGAAPVLTLGNGNLVVGFNIVGTNDGNLNDLDDAVIVGNGVSDIVIRDVAAFDGGAGLLLTGASNVGLDLFQSFQSHVGIAMFGVNGVTMKDTGVDGALGMVAPQTTIGLYIEDSTNVVTDSSGSDLTITDIGGLAGVGLIVNSTGAGLTSNILIDGFNISLTTSNGVSIFGGTNLTLTNGTIADVNTVGPNTSGGGISISASAAAGPIGIALDNIDISGVSGTGTVPMRSAVQIAANNGSVTASFTDVDVTAQNSGGMIVTGIGFGFATLVGGSITLMDGGGNDTNTAAACQRAISGGSTLTGTITINGNPEPGTSC